MRFSNTNKIYIYINSVSCERRIDKLNKMEEEERRMIVFLVFFTSNTVDVLLITAHGGKSEISKNLPNFNLK